MNEDGFEQYYTEKIWEMIPAVYRYEDEIFPHRGTLRAFVEAMADQAAVVRRSMDRLWDDQFIELCDDWAVPYIADLLGTRLVPVLNPRGQRVDVAKTVYYRRRKGTPRVLEELISDIAGWDGVVVENFRLLARAWHGLEPSLEHPRAGHASTSPGGWADLRKPLGAERAGGPFDMYHHTPDMRRHRGRLGRYGISKIALHLYRQPSFKIAGVVPAAITADGGFTFDPSGRDVPLFVARNGRLDSNREPHRRTEEWDLPGPMRCRLLADLEGKKALLPHSLWVDATAAVELTPDDLVAGDLESWTTGAPGEKLVIDPERGRLRLPGGTRTSALEVSYCVGFSGEVGSGTYDRRHVEQWDTGSIFSAVSGGVIDNVAVRASRVFQIGDSRTYTAGGELVDFRALAVQAANRQRPYVRLVEPWVFDAANVPVGMVGEGTTPDAELVLDGLWIGGGNCLALRGSYERVTIRHVTLDPGGADGRGGTLAATRLLIEGYVEELCIQDSILGPLVVSGNGRVERLVIQDSILHARSEVMSSGDICGSSEEEAQQVALNTFQSDVELKRTTVIGDVHAYRLRATEALVIGFVQTTDMQKGCFRFSACFSDSRLPQTFRSVELTKNASVFGSSRFGDPDYCRLSSVAPASLREGGEDGSEIGVFGNVRTPIRMESLRNKVAEYLPFGFIPAFVVET